MNNGDALPHMTMRTLTDYLTSSGAHQRYIIIQNMRNRLGRRAFAPYYQGARSAIRKYAAGERSHLERQIQRLLRDRAAAITTYEQHKIDANLRVITDYRGNFGDSDILHEGRQFAPLVVEGVRVSTEPTLSGSVTSGRRRIPCNVIIDCQEEPPIEAEIDYALELLHRGAGVSNPAPPAGVQYWHPGSGDVWSLGRPSIRRWRDIQAACREIALRWPTVGR